MRYLLLKKIAMLLALIASLQAQVAREHVVIPRHFGSINGTYSSSTYVGTFTVTCTKPIFIYQSCFPDSGHYVSNENGTKLTINVYNSSTAQQALASTTCIYPGTVCSTAVQPPTCAGTPQQQTCP